MSQYPFRQSNASASSGSSQTAAGRVLVEGKTFPKAVLIGVIVLLGLLFLFGLFGLTLPNLGGARAASSVFRSNSYSRNQYGLLFFALLLIFASAFGIWDCLQQTRSSITVTDRGIQGTAGIGKKFDVPFSQIRSVTAYPKTLFKLQHLSIQTTSDVYKLYRVLN